MSKADEMFEELGYKEYTLDDGFHNEKIYIRNDKYATKLRFDFKHKVIIPYYLENKEGAISMKMLQAINEKVKELGWNEERRKNI